MAVPSSPEEAPSALVGAHLLLRRVELRGRELLGSRLVRYDALLHLLVVSSDPKHLPGSYDAVVKSIHHVEDVSAAEAHLAFLRLLVMEVSPGGRNTRLVICCRPFTNRNEFSVIEYSLYVEGVASARRDDLIVLLTSMLHYEINLLLQAEKEQHRFLSSDSLHVHVVDLPQELEIF